MPRYCEPASVDDVREIVREASSLRVVGAGTKMGWAREEPSEGEVVVSTRRLTGVVEWFPEDLVATVRAGERVSELQEELGLKGLGLPLPPGESFWQWVSGGMPGTIGGLVSTRLPTRWDFWTHGVRYWVLGMKVVLSDGTLLRCGSRAVKNVAGYDMHKLFTGAWGSLGVIVEVTLRLFPKHSGERKRYPERVLLGPGVDGWSGEPPLFIGRFLRGSLKGFLERLETPFWVGDAMTGTFWASGDFSGAVEWGMGVDAGGHWFFAEVQNKSWMSRLKGAMDAEHKFQSPLNGVF